MSTTKLCTQLTAICVPNDWLSVKINYGYYYYSYVSNHQSVLCIDRFELQTLNCVVYTNR